MKCLCSSSALVILNLLFSSSFELVIVCQLFLGSFGDYVSCPLYPVCPSLQRLLWYSVFLSKFVYLLSPQSCPCICPAQYHDKIFNRYTSSPMSMQKLQYCISKLQLQGEVMRFSCVPKCVHSALIPQCASLSVLCYVLLQYERIASASLFDLSVYTKLSYSVCFLTSIE